MPSFHSFDSELGDYVRDLYLDTTVFYGGSATGRSTWGAEDCMTEIPTLYASPIEHVSRYSAPSRYQGNEFEPFEVDGIVYRYYDQRGNYARLLMELKEDDCKPGCRLCSTDLETILYSDYSRRYDREQAMKRFNVEYDPTIRF